MKIAYMFDEDIVDVWRRLPICFMQRT